MIQGRRNPVSTELHTDRLRLRPPSLLDRRFARGLLTDPQVRPYLGGPVATARAAARRALSGGPGDTVWIVETASPRKRLGLISVGPHKDSQDIEVSYQFAPAVWGHGYATEALRCVLDHAARTRIAPRIIAETQTGNTRSTALLIRVGMTELARTQRYGAEQSIFATRPFPPAP